MTAHSSCKLIITQGYSINDTTALGGGSQGFCDNLKCMTSFIDGSLTWSYLTKGPNRVRKPLGTNPRVSKKSNFFNNYFILLKIHLNTYSIELVRKLFLTLLPLTGVSLARLAQWTVQSENNSMNSKSLVSFTYDWKKKHKTFL